MDDMMSKIQQVLNDEQSMNQIKTLAGMLSAGSDNDSADNQPSFVNQSSDSNDDGQSTDFDIEKLMKIAEIFKQVNNKDTNTQFLLALKPLLKNEKQVKVDKVIKILKLLAMWPVIKESGLLGGDLFDFL